MSLSEEQKVWLARYSGYKGDNFDEEIDIDKRLLVIRTAEEVEKSTLQRVHLDQMRQEVAAITDEILCGDQPALAHLPPQGEPT